MSSSYKFELLASNDHEELEMQLNAWLLDVNPARILGVQFVADGQELTYCVLVLYVVRKPVAEG
jgi:hypothetical protein